VVRYDSMNGEGELALRDSTSREWSLGRVPAPATRILWLDRPPVDSLWRRALDRAFDESSLYDETVRTAAFHPRAPRRAAGHHVARHRHARLPAHRTARGGRA
jgi:hypothetical protein